MTKNYDLYGISAVDYPGHGRMCGCLSCTDDLRATPIVLERSGSARKREREELRETIARARRRLRDLGDG